MNFKGLTSSKPLHPIQMAWFILMELLLLFGETFSKFHVFGPFHLFDLSFLVLAVWSVYYFFKQPKSFLIWPIFIILAFSIAYLAYSYFTHLGPVNYIIRQYAMFFYMGASWLIFASFITPEYHKYNVRFIALMGIAAIGIQLIYHVYLVFFTDDFSLFGAFNYYNKMVVIALIVGGAYVLVYIENKWLKIGFGIFYLLLATTLGHSSAFLAAFFIIMAYLVMKANRKVKLVGLGMLVLLLIVFIVFLPQFSDHNAEWRVVFWKISLQDIIFKKYGILGHGFGVPYSSQEVLDAFRNDLNSPWFEVRPEEQYLSPMHNSFITMAFHLGLIPALFVFVPLIPAAKYLLFTDAIQHKPEQDFLVLAIIGGIVWSSFNVVLELPHSSTYFWLIYFSLIYSFKIKAVGGT